MPLSSLSGPEGDKYLTAAQKADSGLLKGLAEYFLAVASIEESDPRRPNSAKLQAAASRFQAIKGHLDASVQAAEEMLSTIPSRGSSELETMIKFRVQSAIANTKKFLQAASYIQKDPSKYPSMAECINAISAIQSILEVFKLNAEFHKTEGL